MGVPVSGAQYTPLPWQVNDRDPTQVCDCDGKVRGCAPIAITFGKPAERRDSAALIVKCVNEHEALMQLVQEAIDGDPDRHVLGTDWHERAAKVSA